MSKLIGVIVDGPGDYASIRARFSGQVRVVKTDGPRGHTVPVKQLVLGSKKQISMLKAIGCPSVILVLDFEARTIDYGTFIQQLKEELQRQAMSFVHVCVPNRMIENWYLADVEEISAKKAYIRDDLQQTPFEGTHGKKELKKLFVKGISYKETVHGPQLFAVIRFDIATINSDSLKCFLEKLG